MPEGMVRPAALPPGWSSKPSAGRSSSHHRACPRLFGDGSRTNPGSSISYLLPIPPCAFGTLADAIDAVTGAIAGPGRWRTIPWMVIVFGKVVGPLGEVSVLLVILQPVMFDAWCTLCLASAVASVRMIGPAMDECLASLQHVCPRHAAGVSLWQALRGLSRECGRGS
jgi:hypothetical protein